MDNNRQLPTPLPAAALQMDEALAKLAVLTNPVAEESLAQIARSYRQISTTALQMAEHFEALQCTSKLAAHTNPVSQLVPVTEPREQHLVAASGDQGPQQPHANPQQLVISATDRGFSLPFFKREPPTIMIYYRPFLAKYPEVNFTIDTLTKAGFRVVTGTVNENDTATQQVKGPRILLFSVADIGRVDDIYNMETFFSGMPFFFLRLVGITPLTL